MRENHPAAETLPALAGPAFAALAADIAANGLAEPILLHPDGRVIDGRARQRACIQAGVEPRYVIWDGEGSLLALVLGRNIQRRQLSTSQRALIAASAKPIFAAEAKERMVRCHAGRSALAKWPYLRRHIGSARDHAARLLNVSPRTVERACVVLRDGAPELIGAVREGRVKVGRAVRIATETLERQAMLVEIAGSRPRKRPPQGVVPDPRDRWGRLSPRDELIWVLQIIDKLGADPQLSCRPTDPALSLIGVLLPRAAAALRRIADYCAGLEDGR